MVSLRPLGISTMYDRLVHRLVPPSVVPDVSGDCSFVFVCLLP